MEKSCICLNGPVFPKKAKYHKWLKSHGEKGFITNDCRQVHHLPVTVHFLARPPYGRIIIQRKREAIPIMVAMVTISTHLSPISIFFHIMLLSYRSIDRAKSSSKMNIATIATAKKKLIARITKASMQRPPHECTFSMVCHYPPPSDNDSHQ